MMSSLAWLVGILLLVPALAAGQYRAALPGYHYHFPRDHFSHPDFQTEWWYYTGNVKSADGHRFGFELTFFREGVDRDPTKTSSWAILDLYVAHLALSDLDGRRFYRAERTNRAGPGLAGASEAEDRVWNGNWEVRWQDGDQKLQAVEDRFELQFTLHSEKAPVIHGENGVSQRAAGLGQGSHYISLTRLATRGRIRLLGKDLDVEGLAWMDHEFFTHQLENDQVGWDWLSAQLDDNTELMLFRIRRRDGSVDPYSSGTFVDARGESMPLPAREFALQPANDTWTSAVTRAVYPVHWKISVPKLAIDLEVLTPLPEQEMSGGTKLLPNYWEGAVILNGRKGSSARYGVGYLEMTGYDRPFEIAN
jgi:predicted secreted hydrolase